jgi:hypothetical protein
MAALDEEEFKDKLLRQTVFKHGLVAASIYGVLGPNGGKCEDYRNGECTIKLQEKHCSKGTEG